MHATRQFFEKFLPLMGLFLIASTLASCSNTSLVQKLAPKKRPRLGILTLQVTAPLKKEYSINDLEDRATQKLISSLKEMVNFEPAL